MSNAQLTASASMADGIANRAQKLRKGPLPYIGVFIRAMPDLWSPTNRAGWIPLVVAENKLANDKILERMQQVTQYPTWVMNYGGMKGSFQLQAAMAALINRTFVPEPKLEIEHMCILAGCR